MESSGVQEFRSSGVQEFRSSGVQEFRSSGALALRKQTAKVKCAFSKFSPPFGEGCPFLQLSKRTYYSEIHSGARFQMKAAAILMFCSPLFMPNTPFPQCSLTHGEYVASAFCNS
jgi:hypothetical protein